MEEKFIIIKTNTPKKGKLDRRSFACQVHDYDKYRLYLLKNTRRDLTLMNFAMTVGCRIFDNGVCYPIQEIHYSARPACPGLVVLKDLTI